jgi:hypothetical protein
MSEMSERYENRAVELAEQAESRAGASSMHPDKTYAQLSTTYALLALLHKDDK